MERYITCCVWCTHHVDAKGQLLLLLFMLASQCALQAYVVLCQCYVWCRHHMPC